MLDVPPGHVYCLTAVDLARAALKHVDPAAPRLGEQVGDGGAALDDVGVVKAQLLEDGVNVRRLHRRTLREGSDEGQYHVIRATAV